MALDHTCEVFAVPKWVGVRTKEVRARLSDPAALPSVTEARRQIAQTMGTHLNALHQRQQTAIDTRLTEIEEKRRLMAQKHRGEREALHKAQQERTRTETPAWLERYRKGLRGLLDRVTGRHRRIKAQNEREVDLAAKPRPHPGKRYGAIS